MLFRSDLLLGGGTLLPADGFSFNFGTNFPAPSTRPQEEGVNLTNVLTVCVDTFDNGSEFGPDDTAPAIEAKIGGQQIAFRSMAGGNRTRPPAARPRDGRCPA